MKVAVVTGSRAWSRDASVHAALESFTPDMLIHGACPTGADAIADRWARQRGVPVVVLPALWKQYGKPAGMKRNGAMVQLAAILREHGHAVMVLAFPLPEGKGTQDCMRRARAAQLTVRVVE